MRRRWGFLASCTAAAGAMVGTAAIGGGFIGSGQAAGGSPPAAVASPPAAVASPSAVASPPSAIAPSPVPTAPSGGQQRAVSRSSGAPGACPTGGLDWTVTGFTVVPVDTGNWEWLVQEQGIVANHSAAAILLGDGVGRVARTAPTGQGLTPVVDLPLTPAGSVTLSPGQAEPYSAAELVESATPPQDLGPGLSDASWVSAALVSGCPGPAGAAPGRGSPTSLE